MGSKGKKIRKKNGSDLVRIYGLHGSFQIKNQRYILTDGSCTSYLALNSDLSNGFYTHKLADFIEEWSQELSYEKESILLHQMTSAQVLSPSGIQSYLERKAEEISKVWLSKSQTSVNTISVLPDIAIYEEQSEEVILMMDDVGVKAQKPYKKVNRSANDAKRLDTTVVLIQDTKQGYHYATQGINKAGETIYGIEKAIVDKVCQYHSIEAPLPIVAITDGARSIRLVLKSVFGVGVCIILDWYHLQLKVKNLMSMIATNKTNKELFINDLKSLLWAGNVSEALVYIDTISCVKNQEKRQELRDYLEKHQSEIINYGLRQAANKTIGSGRVEKANDLVVAHRQKKKGMAWSKTGSSALAIIKINRINQKMAI
jgi:hypothetical protein